MNMPRLDAGEIKKQHRVVSIFPSLNNLEQPTSDCLLDTERLTGKAENESVPLPSPLLPPKAT